MALEASSSVLVDPGQLDGHRLESDESLIEVGKIRLHFPVVSFSLGLLRNKDKSSFLIPSQAGKISPRGNSGVRT